MCFKNLFKKKVRADDLFQVRATRSVDTIKEMKKLLGGEERNKIAMLVAKVENEKDKFTSLSATEVAKIFDNLDKIVVEIKRCATEKATFSNNEFRTHSLTESTKVYVKVLEHYVNNNVIAGSFRMEDGELENVLKAVRLTSSREEYENNAQKYRDNIKALSQQMVATQKQVDELKDKILNDDSISDAEAKLMLRDVKQLEAKIAKDKKKLASYEKSLKQVEDTIESIDLYAIMLERFFEAQSYKQDPIVTEVTRNAGTLGDEITKLETEIDINNGIVSDTFDVITIDSSDTEEEEDDLLKQRKVNMENKKNIDMDTRNFLDDSGKQEVNNKF